MNSPRKPDDLDLLLVLADAMSGGSGGAAIEAAEARGQRELVNSEVIPAKGSDDLAALGFKLGDPVPGDSLFRYATLPDGWKRQPSDHSMWSHVVDELGRKRVAMFYKAAFYDRDAFCRAETVYGYVLDCLYHGQQPLLDASWVTREAFADALNRCRKDAQESIDLWSKQTDSYATEYEAEARARLEKISALEAAGSQSGGAA